MKEIGLILKYGKLVPGRESQAIELFAEATRYVEEQVKKGAIAYYEPFFYVGEGIAEQLERSSKAAAEFAPVG